MTFSDAMKLILEFLKLWVTLSDKKHNKSRDAPTSKPTNKTNKQSNQSATNKPV